MMVIKIRASVYENIVNAEDDANELLDEPGKYKRWFWVSQDGLWLMDMSFYYSPEYGKGDSNLCVVYCGAMFPRYDKATGAPLKGIGGYMFKGDPDPALIKKYNGEIVEIVGDF